MNCSRKTCGAGACLLILLAVAAPGCHNDPKTCNDITPGAIPQPSGTYLCQWNRAEMARADRDNFVIYHYEWSAEATKLTQSGKEHVARIAQELTQVPFPVVIECTSDQRMDESRRMAVLESLANCHAPITPDRVVLGRSDAEGLYGDEAAGVAGRMLRNNIGGGQGGGAMGGGGATGSSGGGGTSGGGGMSGGGVY